MGPNFIIWGRYLPNFIIIWARFGQIWPPNKAVLWEFGHQLATKYTRKVQIWPLWPPSIGDALSFGQILVGLCQDPRAQTPRAQTTQSPEPQTQPHYPSGVTPPQRAQTPLETISSWLPMIGRQRGIPANGKQKNVKSRRQKAAAILLSRHTSDVACVKYNEAEKQKNVPFWVSSIPCDRCCIGSD